MRRRRWRKKKRKSEKEEDEKEKKKKKRKREEVSEEGLSGTSGRVDGRERREGSPVGMVVPDVSHGGAPRQEALAPAGAGAVQAAPLPSDVVLSAASSAAPAADGHGTPRQGASVLSGAEAARATPLPSYVDLSTVSSLHSSVSDLRERAFIPLPEKEMEHENEWRTASAEHLVSMSEPHWALIMIR